MVFIRKTLPFLLFAFALSILARWPQLSQVSVDPIVDATTTVCTIHQHWETEKLNTLNCLPVVFLPQETPLHGEKMNNGIITDDAGNGIYIAHPPFSYYAPYAIFKLLSVSSGLFPLRVFHLFLHFISGLFVYLIVSLLSFKRGRSMLHFPSFVAYLIYIFLPSTLWFQGIVYTPDTAYMTLFVIGVYTVLKLIIRDKFTHPKYLFFYTLTLLLMTYTSWLGYFFGGGVLVYSLLHLQHNRRHIPLILLTLISFLIAFRMTVWQYAQPAGYLTLAQEWLNLYWTQGSVSGQRENLFVFIFSYFLWLKHILYNYIIYYFPLYLGGLYGIWIAVTRKKLRIVFSDNAFRFIWLSVTPVILMHIFLMAYSAHAFTILYGALFFSVVSGILYDKMKRSGVLTPAGLNKGVLSLLILFILLFQILH